MSHEAAAASLGTPTRASTSNAARRSTTTTTPSRRGTVDITDEELENGHELETMSASSSSIGLAASNSNASANALTDHGELIPFESTRPPGCSWCRDQSKLHRNPSQFKVSIRDGVKLISLGWRMRGFVNKERSVGREPFIDPFNGPLVMANKGVPLGGIGCGTITRGWRGDFNTFFLHAGYPINGSVKADQFSMYARRIKPDSAAQRTSTPSLRSSASSWFLRSSEPPPTPGDGSAFVSVIAPSTSFYNLSVPPTVPHPDAPAPLTSVSVPNLSSSLRRDASESVASSANLSAPATPGNETRTPRTPPTRWIRRDALDKFTCLDIEGTYHALFPRAWTTYSPEQLRHIDPHLQMTCRQISPVIPNNYKESSYPACVFVWEIENLHPTEAIEVSLMFTFQNGMGGASDAEGGHHNNLFRLATEHTSASSASTSTRDTPNNNEYIGVQMTHNYSRTTVPLNAGNEGVPITPPTRVSDPLAFAIATEQPIGAETVSCMPMFETSKSGAEVWDSFAANGMLSHAPNDKRVKSASNLSVAGVTIGGAVARKVTVPAGGKQEIVFALAWDMPIIRFGDGTAYQRRYMRYFKQHSTQERVQHLAAAALRDWRLWERAIEEWQQPICDDPSIPEWYKCTLFNELYYVTAGGSVWVEEEVLPDGTLKPNDSLRAAPTDTSTEDSTDLERQRASQVLADYLLFSDPEALAEGHVIFEDTEHSTGKIVFGLGDLETGVQYQTKGGLSLVRKTAKTALLDGKVKLTIPITPAQRAIRTPDRGAESDLRSSTSHTSTPRRIGEDDDDANDTFGRYLYLESHEYLMYNTYDVHFYASFALIQLWPQLELNLQRDIARCTLIHTPLEMQMALADGVMCPVKLRGAVPHDVGVPSGSPWKRVNGYCIHEINAWKDLNSKFALQVYRDYVATQDLDFLSDMWEVVWEAMHYLERFDADRDGMIENGGFPDQTYDTWDVVGPSAYCGGLWIAALAATAAMAKALQLDGEQQYFDSLRKKAQGVYNAKLWNGRYYNYDQSNSPHSVNIMADQMAGQWYAVACGLPPIVPHENARSSLKTVYEYNVMGFKNGRMGAINGMTPTKQIDRTCMQSSEVWTGTTYGVAAAMFQEGLFDEAWQTAYGIFRVTYQDYGYWFQTPEAWDENGGYRAISYMRPLAVWAIEWARLVVPKLNVETLTPSSDKDRDLAFGLFERSVESSGSRNRHSRKRGDTSSPRSASSTSAAVTSTEPASPDVLPDLGSATADVAEPIEQLQEQQDTASTAQVEIQAAAAVVEEGSAVVTDAHEDGDDGALATIDLGAAATMSEVDLVAVAAVHTESAQDDGVLAEVDLVVAVSTTTTEPEQQPDATTDDAISLTERLETEPSSSDE